MVLYVARFWEKLQESLGTHVIRSSAYHPQTDGQTERVNQILEDMLRACALHYGKDWDKCLSLAEFSYNNSYQSSLKMAPFEALYGRRCRTPLNWSQAGEREIFGPDLVLEAEAKVRVITKNLEAAQARQRSYHDKRRKPLQFEVGDHVYLKVSPTKGVQRFGITIFITACSYIIFLAIGLFFAREFFVIQGANEVIADYGYDYLSVILIVKMCIRDS